MRKHLPRSYRRGNSGAREDNLRQVFDKGRYVRSVAQNEIRRSSVLCDSEMQCDHDCVGKRTSCPFSPVRLAGTIVGHTGDAGGEEVPKARRQEINPTRVSLPDANSRVGVGSRLRAGVAKTKSRFLFLQTRISLQFFQRVRPEFEQRDRHHQHAWSVMRKKSHPGTPSSFRPTDISLVFRLWITHAPYHARNPARIIGRA